VASSLTGAQATVVVETLTDGNYLGGSFRLSYGGVFTALLPSTATATQVKSALEAVGGANLVAVTEGAPDTEGGRVFEIDFTGVAGDPPLLGVDTSELTGEGATVAVVEKSKGTDALGTQLKLSFRVPLFCAVAEVESGQCGSPVLEHRLAVRDPLTKVALQTLTIPVNYVIQRVAVRAPDLVETSYFTGASASGWFKLQYAGDTTAAISAEASSSDMRMVLEALPSVQTVRVSRSYAAQSMGGGTVSAATGQAYLTCGSTCGFSDLAPGELVLVGKGGMGDWYKVGNGHTGSETTLPLAYETDASMPLGYLRESSDSLEVSRWARGYEWSITFLRVSGDVVTPLSSPKHGINPVSAVMSIRARDCDSCIVLEDLDAWEYYDIDVAASNSIGMSPVVTVPGVPKEIPGSPTFVSLESFSGTELLLSYSPPASGGLNDINRYTIEWDYFANFSNAKSTIANCFSSGFGRCEITGASIAGQAPYTSLLSLLTYGKTYYARVAARNSASPPVTLPGEYYDTTKWSVPVSGVPTDKVPSPPLSVDGKRAGVDPSGDASLQVMIMKPLSDGGQAITQYYVEWDYSINFDSTDKLFDTIDVTDTAKLKQLGSFGPLIYQIDALKPGVAYWVRVAAVNVMGNGPFQYASESVMMATKPTVIDTVSFDVELEAPTAIKSVNVSWAAAEGDLADGGSPITGYVVEWYEPEVVPEIQKITFIPPGDANATSSATFKLTYPLADKKLTTNNMGADIHPFNLRSELVSLGRSPDISITPNAFAIDHVDVERESLLGGGYEWSVTFLSTKNEGDVYALYGETSDETARLSFQEVQTGARIGGKSEVQIIEIITEGSSDPSRLDGWFRLNFNNSLSDTPWLRVNAGAVDVKKALETLETVREVTVTRDTVIENSPNRAGYQWRVTFDGDTGNMPPISLDTSELITLDASLSSIVNDGDNSIDSLSGTRSSSATPGEMPKGYKKRLVDADLRYFLIEDLEPGKEYIISVSAANAIGAGPALYADEPAKPPQQVPTPPQNVLISPDPGSVSTLQVSFDAPASNRGAEVTQYRVEVDIDYSFPAPITAVFGCPTNNKHSVWEVRVQGAANDPVVGGFFKLNVAFGGNTYTTSEIPYDASTRMVDELGYSILTPFSINYQDNNIQLNTTLDNRNDIREQVFPNDRLVLLNTTTYADEVYVVDKVYWDSDESYVRVKDASLLIKDPVLSPGTPRDAIRRYFGGRGIEAVSRLACVEQSHYTTFCSSAAVPEAPGRAQFSGSLESKIEELLLVPGGVAVDRDEISSTTNDIVWRVTFLDVPLATNDYSLSVHSSSLLTLSDFAGGSPYSTSGSAVVSRIVDSVVYGTCTGSKVVGESTPLNPGSVYFARVTAENDVGFSLPQVSSNSQKPFMTPGAPPGVSLEYDPTSATALIVTWGIPDDNGDLITSYLVEYSTSPGFADEGLTESTEKFVTEADPTLAVTISGLTTGVDVYVRVSAANSLGYGNAAPSNPTFRSPFVRPGVATDVQLAVTSDTMLTVSFDEPTSNGGASITGYRIEWDTAENFDQRGHVNPLNKGTQTVGTLDKSFTIVGLTTGQSIFTRVFAINEAGDSIAMQSTPKSAQPAAREPGKPHTITATTGTNTGELDVVWMRPRIPWHGIPCGGLVTNPTDCPVKTGKSVPASDGGRDIYEYTVSFNERPDFAGFDSGEVVTDDTQYTIKNLIAGRTYYIRVAARNSAGGGQFCSFTDANCNIPTTLASGTAKA